MELVAANSSGIDRKRKRGEVRGIRCHHMLPCPTPMTGPDLLNQLERFSILNEECCLLQLHPLLR
jgi:hypothetical protein